MLQQNPNLKTNFSTNFKSFPKKNKKAILARVFNMVDDLFLDRLGGYPSNTHLIGL